MKTSNGLGVFFVCLVAFLQVNGETHHETETLDVVAEKHGFTTLLAKVKKANLIQKMREETLTLFTPPDDALNETVVHLTKILPRSTELLTKILLSHAVPQKIVLSDLKTGDKVETFSNGYSLVFEVTPDAVKANGVKINPKGIHASNGVIYIIDELLVDPNIFLN